MSLLFDETQEAIGREAQKIIKGFADNSSRLAAIETQGAFEEKLHEIAKEQAWYGVIIDPEYGGLGLDIASMGIIATEYGAIAHGVPFLTSSFGFAAALQLSQSESLKAECLPQIAIGEKIGCFGFAFEQNVIDYSNSLEVKSGKLSGTKYAIIGGQKADFGVFLANENGAPVLVAAALNSPNINRAPINSYDNSRLLADIGFDNTECHIIARADEALEIVQNTLARLAVLYAFEQLGGAEAMMKLARNYAIERKAFGQKIGAFQSVKHRITELYALVELARANAIDASARIDKDFLLAAAAARLSATEAYDTAARDCMQIHGAIGVTWEIGIHLHLRRARALANEIGNGFYWEDVLVEQLEKSNSFGAL